MPDIISIINYCTFIIWCVRGGVLMWLCVRARLCPCQTTRINNNQCRRPFERSQKMQLCCFVMSRTISIIHRPDYVSKAAAEKPIQYKLHTKTTLCASPWTTKYQNHISFVYMAPHCRLPILFGGERKQSSFVVAAVAAAATIVSLCSKSMADTHTNNGIEKSFILQFNGITIRASIYKPINFFLIFFFWLEISNGFWINQNGAKTKKKLKAGG